ncbi:hypothetical protein CHCC14809_1992 [Bacillus licheniformis]|nr:hypothetical protein B4090_2710 [Bacillus licheniformis]TWK28943.1 hypothetical protein CHCC20369_0290 [Bacillus licheniformis]TWK43998.1 hypothetical protein CHCC20368_3891 [Bacillus licheniformis]TWL06535.1 hypothetical protein CHCC20323_2619 [Bacillus licheniformis]TWM17022.1 hypothetical protein CHCC15087_1301 [Bacillus licheniformis]
MKTKCNFIYFSYPKKEQYMKRFFSAARRFSYRVRRVKLFWEKANRFVLLNWN